MHMKVYCENLESLAQQTIPCLITVIEIYIKTVVRVYVLAMYDIICHVFSM